MRPVIFSLLFVSTLVMAAAPAAADLLDPVREKVAAAQSALDRSLDLRDRAKNLLAAGRPDDAVALLPALLDDGLEGRILAARVYFAVQDLDGLARLIPNLERVAPQHPGARWQVYRWWILRDDLARVDVEVRARRRAGNATTADDLIEAELAMLLLDFARARDLYAEVLGRAREVEERAWARMGLGLAAYRQREYDGSLDHLVQALAISAPDADPLMATAQTLIRLGRTDEAITAMELAVTVSPHHVEAHYFLGNGYARKNYTQLYAEYPEAFSDENGRRELERADALLNNGRIDEAAKAYATLHHAHPGWADVLVRLGSLEFSRGRFAEAREQFMAALAVCPEYGRAHNGLAKTLEARRLAVEVHRARNEERFAALPMPDVPGISEFVINWHALSPRHQKQVALSIAPWKRYLPVLIEGDATYYIKPLYELLSETPGQELLRDQRINYDSRLWDDVRGCGGYHTVTGIEDVERTVQNRYNTVLHELTHQVHTVLSMDRRRTIQDLYRGTKQRDDETGDAFLSRYAGGSVWEYFAEGANALYTPRRDDYDTREIVRERLQVKDPVLMALVQELMTDADVEGCYTAAYVNRGNNSIERGDHGAAIAAYHQALAREPGDEQATGYLVFALQVADSLEAALDTALKGCHRDPTSAQLALSHAGALWHGGRGLEAAVEALSQARDRIGTKDCYRVDLELGRLRWHLGDAAGAKRAYARVLEYQSDNPTGLWGLAASHALAREWDEAWPRYEEAVRVRTGVVALRADYARDLLRAGETARAREQLEAALLLDPGSPPALALMGWVLLEEGETEQALERAESALALGPWCDLARMVTAWSLRRLDRGEDSQEVMRPLIERINTDAPPRYVYRAKWGRYDEVQTRPRVLEEILALAEDNVIEPVEDP